jgi:superfamily II DNA or RNA helicase
MATFDEFYRSLPEDSGKRGEFFEKVFVPWFLRTDPEWSTKIQKIWLWDEYPDRWGKDCGIDLVYQDNTGKHWAVQSKCVSPDREISKAEINSFLSESNDHRIHGRLLIASTDGIGKNAMQVIERQEKQVVCFLREHFRQSEVEFPSTALDLATGRRKDKRRPRPHQQEAIRNVVEGLQTQDRGQLLMACGTGKTLTSLWIKEELNAKRTLVLLPSLSLLSQTLREWTATSREEFNWICVCSDKSVAKQEKTVDDWIEHVSEVGVPVTSDPTEIRQFLRNNKEGIVFSTYQSSPLVAEAQQDIDIPSFDVAFADEAHRCAGNDSPTFGCVLDGQKIRARKRLFMTATPRVLSKRIKTKADTEDIEVASMDDESLFGTVLHRLNFSEAINKELLTDYRVVVIGVDDPEVQAQIIHRPLSTTSNGVETDYETLANHISLAKAIRDYNLQRFITFHGRVKGAKKFSEDHPAIVEWLPTSSKTEKALQTGYVSGEMTSLERNNKIGQLRNLEDGQIGILSNARCLSEGVDVPSLDGIAFIDPRSSQVDIIQAVGRAIRKSEEKSFGYIILPVYLGDTENIEEEILASRFKDIWKVILALKSQDDSLSEVLDRLRLELGKRSESESRDEGLTKIIFDLPQRVQNSLGDSLQTILVRNSTDDWLEKYGEIVAFAALERKTKRLPPHPTLEWWCTKQRSFHKKGILLPERSCRLERIEGWTWDAKEAKWREYYQELCKYKEKYGNLNISGKSNTEFDGLPMWVGIQRTQYNSGKLSVERVSLLETLEGWSWNLRDSLWEDNYKELVKYEEQREGLLSISDNSELMQWITRQRVFFANEKLSQERIDMLQKLKGWTWNSVETRWLNKYHLLKEYVRTEGQARPPRNHADLGQWASDQRKKYSRGKLTKYQISLLEELYGWAWDLLEVTWKEKYEKLNRYSNQFGHSSPSPAEEPDLNTWIGIQRASYKENKLSEDRKMLLECLCGWTWDALEAKWKEQFRHLANYMQKHDSSVVSSSNTQLYSWVARQNRLYKEGKLSEEKVKLLNGLKNWEWDRELAREQWFEKFDALVEYVDKQGSANVPKRNPVIGDWVLRQRQLYKSKALSAEKIDLLEALYGWDWDPFESGWQNRYQELIDYMKEHGSARPPASHGSLGGWVGTQRRDYKNSRISEKRIELLEKLPGWTWGRVSMVS